MGSLLESYSKVHIKTVRFIKKEMKYVMKFGGIGV